LNIYEKILTGEVEKHKKIQPAPDILIHPEGIFSRIIHEFRL